MLTFLKSLLNYIYRSKCYICKKSIEGDILCEDCRYEIEKNISLHSTEINGVKIFSGTEYKENIRKVIKGIKYNRKKEFSDFLSDILYDIFNKIKTENVEYEVMPVPSHKKRVNERKYNHMELIARDFCRKSRLQLNLNCLTRVKNTRPQYKLTTKERKDNLRNAFKVNQLKHDKNKKIIILDDILTTGTTVNEIIKKLNENGIRDIIVITISYTIFHKNI